MNSNTDCPVLIRNNNCETVGNGEISEYPEVIKLNKKRVTIGRSPTVDCCILSQNVSRIHAVIKFIDGEWYCVDQKSLNGVYINKNKMRAGVPTRMRPGDIIQFGNEETAFNLFTFRVPSIKRGCDEREGEEAIGFGGIGSQGVEVKKRAKQTETSEDDVLRRKIEKLEAELDKLKKDNDEKMHNNEKLNAVNEHRLIACEMQLNQTRESLTAKIKEIGGIKERMDELLLAKKRSDQEAIVEKSKLESALHAKEEECTILKELIEEHETEVKSSSQKVNVAAILTNILEAELQCSICNELFVNATTLQCSHTFCSHCIAEWSKKKNDCPICRKPVTMFAPTLVLDAFIDKVLDVLSPELKMRRLETIAEKKQSNAKFRSEIANAFPVAGASGSSAATAGPSRRSSRTTRWGVQDGTGVNGAIEILSSDDTSDEDDDEDDFEIDNMEEEIEGIPGVYYGGYGQCYICDQPGHWSNGCPFR